jgi:hypothetical protein
MLLTLDRPLSPGGGIPLPVLFALTLFVSALLLFLVQPIIAKMILPMLGGTPAVWNTCMVFFQAVLLAGYSYAHLTTTWLGVRRQILLHLGVVLLPLVVLPISAAAGWLPPQEANPIPWLLGLLAVSIGLPFFVLSTTAPLLQKWFASTAHPSARDPYFLYAASNLGSMLALLSYPVFIEPTFALKPGDYNWLSQSWLWTFGYGLMVILVAACAWAVWHAPQPVAKKILHPKSELVEPAPPLIKRLHWIALAFVPSSLLLGATTYITLDIAAIPLLWLVPLTLYLLSFVLVFARLPAIVHKFMVLAMPVLFMLLIFLMMCEALTQELSHPVTRRIGLNLLTLFVVSMVCHGELARTRPSTRYLTQFYLLMSLGGVLGGLFNALVAPLVFKTIVEYRLAMVCACLLLPQLGPALSFTGGRFSLDNWRPGARFLVDLALVVVLGLVAFGLLQFGTGLISTITDGSSGTSWTWLDGFYKDVARATRKCSEWINDGLAKLGGYHIKTTQVAVVVCFGLPILLCYLYVTRSIRFGLGVGALLLATAICAVLQDSPVIYRDRSFFGVLKVEQSGDYHRLLHGTTLHGQQYLPPGRSLAGISAPVVPYVPGDVGVSPSAGHVTWGICEALRNASWDDPRRTPLTYYHRSGPIGQVFESFTGLDAKKHIALIGLGSGTLASYGDPGQSMTFYEIDPAVLRIAQNRDYFTYFSDCQSRGTEVEVKLGDARLRLQEANKGQYDLIVVDAFSSDAIPIHLITREALELYFDKLADDGILAIHISNRYLDLGPVLANLAAELKVKCIKRYDSEIEDHPGKCITDWVLLARHDSDFGDIALDISPYPDEDRPSHADDSAHWHRLSRRPDLRLWTDDFSNILGVFNR